MLVVESLLFLIVWRRYLAGNYIASAMVLGRKLPGLLPTLLILFFAVNILFVMHMKHEMQSLRREPGGHREQRALDSAKENDFVGHLEKIEALFLNLCK